MAKSSVYCRMRTIRRLALSLEALWVTVIVINYVGRLTDLRSRHHTRERLDGSEVARGRIYLSDQ